MASGSFAEFDDLVKWLLSCKAPVLFDSEEAAQEAISSLELEDGVITQIGNNERWMIQDSLGRHLVRYTTDA